MGIEPIGSGAGRLSAESWRLFQKRLHAYVRKRAQARDVDDIVGDILLRLVRGQSSLEAARDPAAWVMRVAASGVADHHRKRGVEKRRRTLAEREMALAAEAPTDVQETAAAEVARCLVPFVKSLPEIYAEVLMLTDVGGMTQVEVAERLGLSLPAVKSRVRRGREKLRQALLRCCALQLDRRGNIIEYRRHGSGCGARC